MEEEQDIEKDVNDTVKKVICFYDKYKDIIWSSFIVFLCVILLVFIILAIYYSNKYDSAVFQINNLTKNCILLEQHGGETIWNMI